MNLWPRQRPLHILRAMCGAIALGAASVAPAAIITVDTVMGNFMMDGACSLPEAMRNASANMDTSGGDCAAGTGTGMDTIAFSIPACAPCVIVPMMQLPDFDDGDTLDGTTQDGVDCADAPLNLTVQIDGGSTIAAGIAMPSLGATVRGLSITNFITGIEIFGDDNVVECSLIGLAADGITVGPNVFGFDIAGAGNVIGGTTPGDGNVISANVFDGVALIASGAGNTLQNNIIGLAANGITPRGNGGHGVLISNNTGPSFIGTPGNGNLISGNSLSGIRAEFVGQTIEDNVLGLDISGTVAVPNVQGGVVLDPGSDGSMVLGNVISGNGGGGVMIVMSDSHTISGNLIGTDPTGTMAIGNLVGIDIIGDSNTISGNLISGHGTGEGIVILQGDFNDIIGNSIGTNISGTAALANGGVGISVFDGTGNTIGGPGGGERNIISGNGLEGVEVMGGPSINGTLILGNYIGVGADGTTPIPNGTGIRVAGGANGTFIGAGGANEGNVISGNTGLGVHNMGSPGTSLIQNLIGLGADGTTVVPNGTGGVLIDGVSSGILVGTDPSVPNVISGNNGIGLNIRGGANNVVVLGNLIGTDSSGTLDRGNALAGVAIGSASGTIIGEQILTRKNAHADKGLCPPCNVISGNDGPGIRAETLSANVLFNFNFIGADINGNPTLPNGGGGIVFDNTPGSLLGNLIAGNIGPGINISAAPGWTYDLNDNRFEFNTGPAIDINVDITISGTSGNNCISGNGAGIDNSSGADVTADFNWWGAVDGPGGTGPGSGDTITTNVTVNSFLVVPPAGCTVTAPPPPPPVDPLTLDVSESIDPVAAGTSFSYTVTVTNIISDTVTGIVVSNTSTLPAGVVIDAVTPSTGSFVAPLWNIPSLPTGGSATLVVDLSVAPSAASGINLISHFAMIAAVGGGLMDDDRDIERTTIAWIADFSITKTSVPDAVVPGSPVTYTIVASNPGPTDAAAVRIMDTFPSELVDVTWTCSGTGGAACPESGVGDVDLFLAMPAGSTITIEAMAMLPVDSDSTGVVNMAVVVAPPGVTDPDGSNNSAGTGTSVVGPLSLLPVVTVLPGATVGEDYEFVFTAGGGLPPLGIDGTGAPAGLSFAELIALTISNTANTSGSSASAITDTDTFNQIARDRPHVTRSKGDTTVSLALSGVPTEAGTFPLTVMVIDSATPAQMIERDYLLQVIESGGIGALLPDAVVGASYGGQLEAAALLTPVTWMLSGGSLPPGLVLNETGLVNGIPTQAGEFPFSATATGVDQSTLTDDFSITVNEMGLFSLTTSIPNGLIGADYDAPVLVDGGTPPYDCTLQGGNLPPGLAIDGCVTSIRGMPTLAGTFDFVVRAADSSAPAFTVDIPLRAAIAADTDIPAGEPPEMEEMAAPVEVPNSGRGSPGLDLPDESLQHIAVDAFGHQYFTGYAWNGVTYDIQIFKYDKLDRRVWQQSFDSGGQDYGYGIAISPVDQGIYISGYLLFGTQFQAVLLKYDLNGLLLWERRTSAGQLLDAWYALAADDSGVYAVGERYNGLNFDALFDKYDHMGNLLWENVRDTFDTESAYAVTLLDCKIDDPGPCRLYTGGAEGITPRAGWVAELNPGTGVILQDNGIDNSARVLALITDLDGNLLAGATDDLTSDWRLFNLDTSLMTNWQTTYTPGDVLRSLAVDRENFIYAGGSTQIAPINALVVVFGDGGVVLNELVIDNDQNEGINGTAIDPANRLVAIGQRSGPAGATFLVYRIFTGKGF